MKFLNNLFLVLLVFSSVNVFGQKNNVQNAFRALEKENIEEAVEYIELAAANSSTANDVKMHNYRGKIYFEVYSNEKFKALDDMAILKCAESWEVVYNHPKAKKWFDEDELTNNITKAGVGLFNKGVEMYNKKNFDASKKIFNKIFDLLPLSKDNLQRSNVTQESIWLNLFYVSYAEKNNSASKEYLQKLIDVNYQDPQIYSYYSNILSEEGKQEEALEILKIGREFFETDVNLIIAELNFYLAKEDFIKAEELLTLAVEEDPNNHQLFFALGSSYDNLGDFEKAENAYKEAVDIKPDFYDGLYNLGVMYYNKGGDMLKTANNIKDYKKYEIEKTKADDMMLKGLPYIEKCYSLKPEDRNILLVLKELYYRNGNDEGYKKVNDLLK